MDVERNRRLCIQKQNKMRYPLKGLGRDWSENLKSILENYLVEELQQQRGGGGGCLWRKIFFWQNVRVCSIQANTMRFRRNILIPVHDNPSLTDFSVPKKQKKVAEGKVKFDSNSLMREANSSVQDLLCTLPESRLQGTKSG